MRADIEKPGLFTNTTNGLARRPRVVIADASPSFMSVVLSVLEFHEVVDLVGRVPSKRSFS